MSSFICGIWEKCCRSFVEIVQKYNNIQAEFAKHLQEFELCPASSLQRRGARLRTLPPSIICGRFQICV